MKEKMSDQLAMSLLTEMFQNLSVVSVEYLGTGTVCTEMALRVGLANNRTDNALQALVAVSPQAAEQLGQALEQWRQQNQQLDARPKH